MAGATGFAPIKGMIEYARHKGINRPMALYWGVQSAVDLYQRDIVRIWEAELPHFTFVPVLSAPLPEDQWTGRTGFVHQAILDDFSDLSCHQVYACGASRMVEAGFKTFTEAVPCLKTSFIPILSCPQGLEESLTFVVSPILERIDESMDRVSGPSSCARLR
ncbi:CDP-6-deoxy-delta-3,4-glucoseen reductase [mine drainage metagenome]|uniref:CDP-6-deoxy-delta-3,4-glucoseen reductase n=1 Tax=mine drainage metagenome TaxID=410659 RepID=T1BQX4_9ZZZZ